MVLFWCLFFLFPFRISSAPEKAAVFLNLIFIRSFILDGVFLNCLGACSKVYPDGGFQM